MIWLEIIKLCVYGRFSPHNQIHILVFIIMAAKQMITGTLTELVME